MVSQGAFRLGVAFSICAVAGTALALIPPDISQVDYESNIPATNSARFNATLPPGGAFPLVDPTGAAYENPPAGWTPDGHWQSPAENPQFGVVKRYGATTDFFGTEQNPNQLIDPSLPSEVAPRVELEVELAGIK